MPNKFLKIHTVKGNNFPVIVDHIDGANHGNTATNTAVKIKEIDEEDFKDHIDGANPANAATSTAVKIKEIDEEDFKEQNDKNHGRNNDVITNISNGGQHQSLSNQNS